MTTCYSDSVAYVHIPKCGGTSIGGMYDGETETWRPGWLSECCDGITRDNLPIGHIPVRAIGDLAGRRLDDWQIIIGTIRNPFAQQVSQYEFWRTRGRKRKQEGKNLHPCDRLCLECSFAEFVAHPWSDGSYFVKDESGGVDWRGSGGVYRWWLVDGCGQVPSNVSIVKLEEIAERLPALVEPFAARTIPPVPRENRIGKADAWRDYYDAATARVVAQKFRWSLVTQYPELLVFPTEIDLTPASAGR